MAKAKAQFKVGSYIVMSKSTDAAVFLVVGEKLLLGAGHILEIVDVVHPYTAVQFVDASCAFPASRLQMDAADDKRAVIKMAEDFSWRTGSTGGTPAFSEEHKRVMLAYIVTHFYVNRDAGPFLKACGYKQQPSLMGGWEIVPNVEGGAQ